MMRALAAALLLTGCATAPVTWAKIDGRPPTPEQLALDQTACQGEMQKSRLSSTMEPGITIGPQGLYSPKQAAIGQVFEGCMAQRGYLRTDQKQK